MRLKRTIGLVESGVRACVLKQRVPLSVSIELTNRCNFKCLYCAQTADDPHEMTTAEIKGLMDDFAELGTQRVGLTGGEPLIRTDLEELIAHSHGLGFVTNVASNGFFVPDQVHRLEGADLVILSLDGAQESHDRLRQPGSYLKVIQSIEALKTAGFKVVTSTVLTRMNMGEDLDFVLDLAQRMGFSAMFTLLYHHARCIPYGEFESMLPSQAECDAAFGRLLIKKQQGFPVLSSQAFLRYMSEGKYRRQSFECLGADLYCAVDPAGNLAACGLQLGEGNQPNGLDDGFKAAWQELTKNECDRHYCNFGVEESMILSLHPGAVVNFVRHAVSL